MHHVRSGHPRPYFTREESRQCPATWVETHPRLHWDVHHSPAPAGEGAGGQVCQTQSGGGARSQPPIFCVPFANFIQKIEKPRPKFTTATLPPGSADPVDIYENPGEALGGLSEANKAGGDDQRVGTNLSEGGLSDGVKQTSPRPRCRGPE